MIQFWHAEITWQGGHDDEPLNADRPDDVQPKSLHYILWLNKLKYGL